MGGHLLSLMVSSSSIVFEMCDHLLLSWMVSSFQIVIQKYKKINSIRVSERCNTHPHNIYLEIWSELGILFFIFFIIFNIYFLFKLFKVYFFNKEYQQEASIIISLYSMLFFPIQTTGSLFSTWNGVIYWICIALCLNLFYKTKKQFI